MTSYMGDCGMGQLVCIDRPQKMKTPPRGKAGFSKLDGRGIGGAGVGRPTALVAPHRRSVQAAPIMPQFPARVALVCVLQGVTPSCSSAVNLKFLSLLAASLFRNFKFQNRTRIIKLLVVLRFRSSHRNMTRALANFGIGPLVCARVFAHPHGKYLIAFAMSCCSCTDVDTPEPGQYDSPASRAAGTSRSHPSAVNLKFLSLLAASSFRNFKFKTALES